MEKDRFKDIKNTLFDAVFGPDEGRPIGYPSRQTLIDMNPIRFLYFQTIPESMRRANEDITKTKFKTAGNVNFDADHFGSNGPPDQASSSKACVEETSLKGHKATTNEEEQLKLGNPINPFAKPMEKEVNFDPKVVTFQSARDDQDCVSPREEKKQL